MHNDDHNKLPRALGETTIELLTHCDATDAAVDLLFMHLLFCRSALAHQRHRTSRSSKYASHVASASHPRCHDDIEPHGGG
jgi:hypothetical protein